MKIPTLYTDKVLDFLEKHVPASEEALFRHQVITLLWMISIMVQPIDGKYLLLDIIIQFVLLFGLARYVVYSTAFYKIRARKEQSKT